METDKIIPVNWKEIICEKKVVLYNTGVSSLLQGREKRIEKMRWVFEMFQKHPEVVLWWRPHPLELDTIHSMLPELKEQYMELLRQYKEKKIGILDESADLHRAVTISDAYYGAWSSIAELYKATKKPVLYENINVREISAPLLWPNALCIKDDFIWFIQANSNKLVKVNRETYRIESIINIPLERVYKNRLYNDHIIDIGNSLLLLLEKSRQIYEFEIATGDFMIHRPSIKDFKITEKNILERKGRLYLFPYAGNSVVEYDYRRNLTELAISIGEGNAEVAKCCETVEDKIYMVKNNSNTIYLYHFKDRSYVKKNVGGENNRYWGIKRAGNYFVLPHLERKAISLWDEDSGKLIELTDFPDQYRYWKEHAYLDMFEKDGVIYIFPFYANMILKVDIERKSIVQAFSDVICKPDYDINSEHFSSETYLSIKRYENCIYAYATYKKSLQIFDLDKMEMQEIGMSKIENKDYARIMENILNTETCEDSFCEGESSSICNLENYLLDMQVSYKNDKERKEDKNSIGKRIYKKLTEI